MQPLCSDVPKAVVAMDSFRAWKAPVASGALGLLDVMGVVAHVLEKEWCWIIHLTIGLGSSASCLQQDT